MADNTAQNGTATIAADDIGGVHYQRVKNCHGADGTAIDVSAAAPMPVFDTHTGRTFVSYFATGVAAAATTTDALLTLTKSPGPGAATTTASSNTVPSGKRFRITSITFSTRGHATATIQTTTFRLRVNPAGATTTGSPISLEARLATPATASAWDRWQIVPDDDGLELLGDGTLTFGISAVSTYTTNAPTLDVVITGYEYTP